MKHSLQTLAVAVLSLATAGPGCDSSTPSPAVGKAVAKSDHGDSQVAGPSPPDVTDPMGTVGTSAAPPNEPSKTAGSQPAGQTPNGPPALQPTSHQGEVVDISFDDLNLQMQENMVFRDFLLEAKPETKALDGKRIRISGFMYGGVQKTEGITDFVLLKNTQCKYGPGGQADHLLIVKLMPGETAKFTADEFFVEGVLRIAPTSGPGDFTWSMYDLVEAVVTRGVRKR